MKKILALTLLSAVVFFSGSAALAGETIFGVVDVNKVFSEYYRVAESQEEFSAYQQERTGELEKKALEVEPLQVKLNDPELSAEEREALQEKIMELRREITVSYQNLQQELQRRNHELVEARLDEITEAIAFVGEAKNCRLVINHEVVLYEGPGTVDITEDTIEHLNRDAPQKSD